MCAQNWLPSFALHQGSKVKSEYIKKCKSMISYMLVMGVFHWGRLVGNYRFFEGQEQCLQSWIGLVVVSRLVAVECQNIKYV